MVHRLLYILQSKTFKKGTIYHFSSMFYQYRLMFELWKDLYIIKEMIQIDFYVPCSSSNYSQDR